jgi:membrane protein
MDRRRAAQTDDLRVEHDGQPREDGHGRGAEQPTDIPKAGWMDVGRRVKSEIKDDRVPLVSAGVAFYAMLALFPAITALISIYGLVADPGEVEQQINDLAGGLQGGAGDLIADQASSIAQAGTGALTAGLAISILAALWTASSGMHGLMQALTVANNEEETRGFIKRRAVALALTIVGIVVVILAIGVVVGVPIAMEFVGLGAVGEWAIRILRWPLIGLVIAGVLAVIYRYGPDRDEPRWRWVSAGAVVATVLWLLGSIAFSIYVSNFGNYNETYGALAGVIVLLLWLFLSAFVVILGAEINSELEHQTARDTTRGEPRPMGQRDAQVADEVADREV